MVNLNRPQLALSTDPGEPDRYGAALLAVLTELDQDKAAVADLATKADQEALTTGLAGKADLVNGKLPSSQLPALNLGAQRIYVASKAARLALLPAQVQSSDAFVIVVQTDTAPATLWTLVAGGLPGNESDWLPIESGGTDVTVNGVTGTNITLAPADIGAPTVAAFEALQQTVAGLQPLADIDGGGPTADYWT